MVFYAFKIYQCENTVAHLEVKVEENDNFFLFFSRKSDASISRYDPRTNKEIHFVKSRFFYRSKVAEAKRELSLRSRALSSGVLFPEPRVMKEFLKPTIEKIELDSLKTPVPSLIQFVVINFAGWLCSFVNCVLDLFM